MKSLLEVAKLSAEYLLKKGVRSPAREAEDLVSESLGLKRLDIYIQHDRPMTSAELDLIRARLERRSRGEPFAYIHGAVNFLDCLLEVSPAVLIPRQETEILVDKIAAQAKAGVLWDLCTGSGAIGIALKKRNPELKVVLSDLSPAALAVAKLNADKNGVEVEIREGDLFNPFKAEQADWIVSNPPYIAEGEWDSLDSEVRGFEPRMALISGRTGLEFYERFSHELPRFLKPGGSAFFEIGKGQGKAVKELFDKAPFENVLVEPDWAGHDRFFSLKIKEDFCKVV